MNDADFYEGVRAKLVEKDGQPNWKVDSLPNMAEYFSGKHDETGVEWSPIFWN